MYPRSDWGARAPKTLARDSQPKGELFIHHSDGFGGNIQTRAQQRATMRAIQDFHMDHNGWSDIAYNYVVFQPQGRFRRARVYEARPTWAVPAAQLNHNSGTLAVCVVGNFDQEKVKRGTVERLKSVVRHVAHRFPIHSVRGHRDVVSTDCPGDRLYAFVPVLQGVLNVLRGTH